MTRMAIFQPEFETLERRALEALQLERFRALVERLRAANEAYGDRLRGVKTPESLEDLAALPWTTKADLRDGYPLGLLAVPVERLARIHASSGTTGNPTVGAYTREDLRIFGEVNARSLAAGGIEPGDMFQVAWGYGLFTGGLGMHGGCETLGACAVPASSGNTARQLQLLADLPVVGIGATPSYALVLAERFRAENRRPKALKYAICGAESWTREMRNELEALFGVTATNIYGLTEIIGPGVAQECLEKQGLHVQEDHFLAEIVDPETGAPLADGERGELVITTLTREAMPVLRYRTHDLTSMVRERCACGRTTARIDWFTGRVDDMLTIRGINVFPSAVEEVLLRFPELSANYRIYVDRPPNGLDVMLVEVEHQPAASIEDLASLGTSVSERLAETLLISLETRVVRPGTIERIEAGKAKRVIDRRA
jgi:phenylacetate-CoA ligase